MTESAGPLLLGRSTGTVGFVKTVLMSYTGIGLFGFVVSHETSQMTDRLRDGWESDSLLTNGGMGSER